MSDRSQSGSAASRPAAAGVVMLTGDLMFASRVKAAAARAGLDFRISGELPSEQAESIRYVILDLSTRSGLAGEIVGQCSQRCPHATLIAYGPHVQVDKLQQARDAGIERVMTNGQFNSQLSQLFQ